MGTFFTGFVFFMLMVAIMAVGVICGRPPIRGTCGGLNQMAGNSECEFCGGDTGKCESQADQQNSGILQHYDAEKTRTLSTVDTG